MARTPATHNDAQITRMLRAGNSVAAIAAELNVSEPTVYNAIRRLQLTLPSKSKKGGSTGASRRIAQDSAATSPASTRSATSTTRARSTTGTGPRGRVAAVETGAEQPAATATKASRKARSTSNRPAPPATASTDDAAAASKPVKPGTGLVPIGPDTDLLTVRVDKGIELLKNLSARIVRHERELAAARQRYAETLASLALS